MTTPWWRRPERPADADAEPVEEFPELVPADPRSVRAAIAGRIGAFTPGWVVGSAGADAGVALVKVFGEQVEPVAQQVNRLRDKHAQEQLRIAGVTGRGPRPGTVMVVVTLVETAPGPVRVLAGTQLTATAATGEGQVVFETASDLYATPGRLRMLALQAGTRAVLLAPAELGPATPALALGGDPRPGNALWLGLSGPLPFPRLTVAFWMTAATPGQPSVTAGGVGGPPPAGDPTLTWELLTGQGLVPAELQRDDTLGLRQSGIVELATVAEWVPLRHPVARDAPEESRLRWLRVGLLFGRYDPPPRVERVELNAVLAEGAETIRDEILEPVREVTPTPAPARRFQLARRPVLRNTVRLEVDAPDPADLFDLAPARPAGEQRPWVEVDTLARSRPYDQHFVVDEENGIVTFGDGVRGAAVPAGFRHVRATSYRTGGGRATAVPAGTQFVPRDSIPFLGQIDVPGPAAGAADAEPVPDVVARGPALVRARWRGVTAADLEALAVQAAAELGRVVALPGSDVDGTRAPGQLTLVAVGTRRDDGAAPVPTETTLAAVARFLVTGPEPVAPLGTRVVVRAARFARVELEIVLRPDEDAARPAVVLAVTRAVNGYLDPLTGGADRRGWPLGQALRYRRLVSVVAGVAGVASVGRIAVVVDGRRSPPCRDASLPPCTLPWPGNHLIVPVGDLGGERP